MSITWKLLQNKYLPDNCTQSRLRLQQGRIRGAFCNAPTQQILIYNQFGIIKANNLKNINLFE